MKKSVLRNFTNTCARVSFSIKLQASASAITNSVTTWSEFEYKWRLIWMKYLKKPYQGNYTSVILAEHLLYSVQRRGFFLACFWLETLCLFHLKKKHSRGSAWYFRSRMKHQENRYFWQYQKHLWIDPISSEEAYIFDISILFRKYRTSLKGKNFELH